MDGSSTFRFLHASDPHFGPVPRPRPGELANKRFWSYLGWIARRHRRHDSALADRFAEFAREEAPDRICLTGDLVNLATIAELHNAARRLRELSETAPVIVAPGNHDLLVRQATPLVFGLWNDWTGGANAREDFPFVARSGPVAFIGLASALPTFSFTAYGRLGEEQMRGLERALRTTGDEGLFRVALLHHPPMSRAEPWRRSLRDAAAFRETARRQGAELILHGHRQKATAARIDGPDGPIPVYGVGSLTAASRAGRAPAHFRGFCLAEDADGRTLEVQDFGFSPSARRFERVQSHSLRYPPRSGAGAPAPS